MKQLRTQEPDAQFGAPEEVHAVAQAPQCPGSFVRLTSQPFAGLPSQSAKPELQVKVQPVVELQTRDA